MIDVGGKRMFACDECPIIEELDRRLAIAREHPEWGDFQFDHCGCDKVEDEFFMCGYCEDAWADAQQSPKKGQRKTGRAYRRQMRTQKFKRQKAFSDHGSMVLGLGVDKSGLPAASAYDLYKFGIDYEDVPVAYIKRPKSGGRKKFYKKYANRVVRRSKGALPKGNNHQKLFDLWWTVY